MLPLAYGDFIAGLAAWDWFVTITFRNEAVSDLAVARINEYLAAIQRSTGKPVGWVLAEEFGNWGGRFHCHLLLTGVARLSRRFWWSEAFRRFGRSEIRPFNPERAAAFYTAKYAAKALGQLHFGGILAGSDLLCRHRQAAGATRLCPRICRNRFIASAWEGGTAERL